MCCSEKCLKRCSILYVVLFLVVSCVQIAYGSYCLFYMYMTNRELTLGQYYVTVPPLVIVLLGITLLSISLLGCCGFIKETTCCINIYAVFLFLTSVLQILLGVFSVLIFTNQNFPLKDQIKEDLKYAYKWYNNDPVLVDNVQYLIHCCGEDSPIDWKKFSLPNSCCGVSDFTCNLNSTFLYSTGCVTKLTDFILYHNNIIGYYSISFGIVEVLAALGGLCLGCCFYTKTRTLYY